MKHELRFGSLIGVVLVMGVPAMASDEPSSVNLAEGMVLIDAFVKKPTATTWTVTEAEIAPFRYDSGSAVVQTGSYGCWGNLTATLTWENANTWAPDAVYRIENWGASTVTFSNLTPGKEYVVELHASEMSRDAANLNYCSVYTNGTLAVETHDLFELSGGRYYPYCEQFKVTAKTDGTIVVTVAKKDSDDPHMGGFAVWGSEAPGKPSLAVSEGDDSALFSWSPATDTLRYYPQVRIGAGEWTDEAELNTDARSFTLSFENTDETIVRSYRLAASNGVAVVYSDVVTPSAVDYVDIKTHGSVIPNDAAAHVRISEAADGEPNTLEVASGTTTVIDLTHAVQADSEIALTEGQALSLGGVAIQEGAGNLSIGTMAGVGTLTPVNGSFYASVLNANSILTFNPSVNLDTVTLTKTGPGSLKVAAPLTASAVQINDGEVQVDVAENESRTLDVPVTGTGDFVKTGKGELTIRKAKNDLSGDVEVREGTLFIGVGDTLYSDTTGKVIVHGGATLDIATSVGANAARLGARQIILKEGATLANHSGKSQYNSFDSAKLEGDATIERASRCDFRHGGTVDLNGHTLTLTGNGWLGLNSMTLIGNGGKIVVESNGLFFDSNAKISGDASSELWLKDGTSFISYGNGNSIPWTIRVKEGSARFSAQNGAEMNINGPVILEGSATIHTDEKQGTVAMRKTVSGAGGVTILPKAKLGLTGANNTFMGGVTVNGGTLLARQVTSFPAGTDLAVSNGTMVAAVYSATAADKNGARHPLNARNVTLKDGAVLQVASLTAETLTVSGAAQVCDTLSVPSWTVDAEALAAGEFITTDGSAATDLSTLETIAFTNVASLSKGKSTVVVSNAAGFVSFPTIVAATFDGAASSRWRLKAKDNLLLLEPRAGFVLLVK